MRFSLATLAVMAAITAPLRAAGGPQSNFDWNRWRDLPVQGGGRYKPFDTLTWEVVRLISNQTTFADPETGEKLNAAALYLSMLFDWQGWDHPEGDRLLLFSDGRQHYFQWHESDRWDQAPLLRVDYLELRTQLGLGADQKYVAPSGLSKTFILDPRSGKEVPFATWANQLLLLEEKGTALTELEKKGLELANRLWTYQNHRMGRGLEILPVPGSDAKEWMPIAQLILTRFDDSTDPSGQYRHLQRLVLQARTAYQKNDAETFNSIADELKSVLRALGEELGEYPSESSMDLEVAYNR